MTLNTIFRAQMGNALNMKWTSGCGSPLTDDNLYYLACKAFRNNNLSRSVLDLAMATVIIGCELGGQGMILCK